MNGYWENKCDLYPWNKNQFSSAVITVYVAQKTKGAAIFNPATLDVTNDHSAKGRE